MIDAKQVSIPGLSKSRRTTIALLTTGAIDPNNRSIWLGTAAAARDAGVNLICYPGRLVRSPVDFEVQRNIIYQMVDAQTVDGIVLMGGLNAWLDTQDTYSFIQSLQPMPVVTTGIVLEGVPGVTVDNYRAMHDVVTHLISVHHHRRIAFIRGQANHQEAFDRYRAYVDVLAEYNIPFDPILVYQGDFKESGGVQGIITLLDERKARFDALVAASDNMAIGALKTLQARGLRVPADVAVAGLNGEDQSLVITPPLTTAPLHFYEQAYQATLMVLALLQGQEVSPKVILPARLVVRQSCGCSNPLVTHAEAIPHTEKLDSFTDEILLLDSLVFGESNARLKLPQDERIQQVFPNLLKLFLTESQGKSEGEFLDRFSEAILQTGGSNDAFPRWHEILSTVRQFAISQLADTQSRLRVENLVQQARVIVGESARQHNAYQVLQADEKLHILGEINQRLSVTTSIAELTDALEHALRLLNIPRGYLFLYENSPDSSPALEPGTERRARFIFAFEDHQRRTLPPEGESETMVFPTYRLLPTGLLRSDRLHSLVVEPLFFRNDQLGYAVFEADPREETIYEILGGQISAALKRTLLTERNIRLFDEAVEARKNAEEARKIAEQANLLKSRFLSIVSHELRTPLALIVGTIEMMLLEEKSGSKPLLPKPYREDMDGIHTSSKHLHRLIGDVLDLASNQAGELHLVSEPLDLVDLFTEAAMLGKSLAREKGLGWREQIPSHVPQVWGDRTRLRQVTINLLSNAVKFTEHGWVGLAVRSDSQYVWVAVSDTGMGIPAEEQTVIFDEFRRSERSVARGYGGMGLGLAITRRLIELHGGQIGVRSTGQDGTGSTFYFSLPLMADAPAVMEWRDKRKNVVLLLRERSFDPLPAVTLEEAPGGGQLQRHLQQKGFDVEVMDITPAAGGQQTDWLSQLAAYPPGAVLLDFQSAAERGWEVMQLIKQNSETRDVPVVFYNLPEQPTHGSVLEMDYLSKPIASTELADALERLGLKGADGRQKILVVDDDAKVLDMHARMLESQVNCRILKAYNGKQALEIIQKEDLALVILDLMMPEVDGFEVLRVMRSQDATRSVPVIVLSAQILTAHDMRQLQDGVAAVLGKGLFTVTEVLIQVEAALNHSKRLGSQAARTVREAMAYIHEHYAESISRVDLARHVALTERYLTHCFRQELGLTPMVYLNRYRVKQARLLLEQGQRSITEVAMAVGFSDCSYFNRVFRQEMGVTPGAYQRGERK